MIDAPCAVDMLVGLDLHGCGGDDISKGSLAGIIWRKPDLDRNVVLTSCDCEAQTEQSVGFPRA